MTQYDILTSANTGQESLTKTQHFDYHNVETKLNYYFLPSFCSSIFANLSVNS